MALPVTVYRWDDAGAPQMASPSKASQLFEVLKKCLVEGYGDKPSLGWTLPFSSADGLELIFKNSYLDGSGSFVKFWTTGGVDSDNGYVYFCGTPMITSINEDILAITNRGFQHSIHTKFLKWILIGTSAGFYLLTNRGSDKMAANKPTNPCFFIGDINSFYSVDSAKFITAEASMSSDKSSVSYIYQRPLGGALNNSYVTRMIETDGNVNHKTMKLALPFATTNKAVNGEATTANFVTFTPVLGVGGATPAGTGSVNFDSENNVCMDSDLHPAQRGTIPGLLQSVYAGFSDQSWPYIKQINSQPHYLLQHPNLDACQMWVNAEQWYD